MYNSGKSDVICTKCYSMDMLQGLRKNCAPAWQHNSDILSGGIIPDHMLPTILDAYFRFSAHGELINAIHLENLHNIAAHNPHCNFALWTKRKDLVRRFYSERPKLPNLILIFSNPKINRPMDTPPEFFDRTFNNVEKHFKGIEQNCTGQKCRDCLLCYVPGNGVSQIVEAVK